MTIALTKGQNMPVASDRLQVTVESGAPADLSALLVTSSGKVRSDKDFVFYNQPEGPGVSVRQPMGGAPWRVDLSLSAVPAEIDKIRVVVSLEDNGSRFGQFAPPIARLTDGSGSQLASYQIVGLDSESIVVALEIYRRDGQWKARAVGQGYAGGLADLVSDHGVVVDAAPAAPVPQYATVAAPVSAAPPPRPVATVPAARGGIGRPGAPVSLVKGQRVSLAKSDGSTLTVVRMGLGWDPVKRKGVFGSRQIDIDLDASAVLFAGSQVIDVVYFGQLRSKDGTVIHTGDNLTGHGDGDDESIVVDLARLSAAVTAIVFVVTSYRGHTFMQVENAHCRLVDAVSRAELARYALSGGANATGMVMAKVYREGPGWKMHAIGDPIQAKTPGVALPMLSRYLVA